MLCYGVYTDHPNGWLFFYESSSDEDIKVSIDGDLNQARSEFYSSQRKKKVESEYNEEEKSKLQ